MKISTNKRNSDLTHLAEKLFQSIGHLIPIVMMTSDNVTCRTNVSITISYGDNSTGFGFFATLIGDIFAPFCAARWLPSRFSTDTFN